MNDISSPCHPPFLIHTFLPPYLDDESLSGLLDRVHFFLPYQKLYIIGSAKPDCAMIISVGIGGLSSCRAIG
jgi:hypothetical protein